MDVIKRCTDVDVTAASASWRNSHTVSKKVIASPIFHMDHTAQIHVLGIVSIAYAKEKQQKNNFTPNVWWGESLSNKIKYTRKSFITLAWVQFSFEYLDDLDNFPEGANLHHLDEMF